MSRPRLHCALYTRKSTEEGLEQAFNSLDAQREACAAYVKSQASEGWRAIRTRYDDGGFSGASMERPALKRLLCDIEAGKVDVVVVYKIDRLTRSLPDFARMIEIFDRRRVSFVSVTQAFNTTTSMGRLTLNVLLSFAQFEREVTGERIRDKIAASKAKGMWMGGTVPLGYDPPANGTRALAVNQAEAGIVRTIFGAYIDLGSVHTRQRWLEDRSIRSKRRVTRAGRLSGGRPFSRGAPFQMLRNRVPSLADEHRPQGPTEEHLVEELASILWRKRRLRLAEAAAHQHGLEDATESYRGTAKAALVHLDSGKQIERVVDAIRATPEKTAEESRDLNEDESMTAKAVAILDAGKPKAYEHAVAALLADTREWWEDVLSRDPEDFDEGETPFTPDADGLRRFSERDLRPWYVQRRKELENRPLIRAQAFGQSLDPDKLSRLARYEVHLDRKLERTLAMLLRLQDLRRETGE